MVTRRVFGLVLLGALLSAAPPERIVSTAPSITELLYALGLGNRVVGVTRFCRYPPEAQLKPKIGDYTSPNLEAIAALRPDLVIIQTNPVHLADRLSKLKLHVLEVDQEVVGIEWGPVTDDGEVASVVFFCGPAIQVVDNDHRLPHILSAVANFRECIAMSLLFG